MEPDKQSLLSESWSPMFPLVSMPQGWEWLVVLAIVVLVFGAAKLPDLARGTGQALRIFKAETKGLKDDEDDDDEKPQPQARELPPASGTTSTNGETVEPRRDTGAN